MKDEGQLTLYEEAIEELNIEQELKERKLEPRQKVQCPFCLYQDYRYKFMHRLHSGKLARSAICPDCQKRMVIDSLEQEMTIEQYAKWVKNYPGYWKSINFEKWSQRLKEAGMSYTFWAEYKKLKAEDEANKEVLEGKQQEMPTGDDAKRPDETFEQYAERMRQKSEWLK
jgi:hypothetical protein